MVNSFVFVSHIVRYFGAFKKTALEQLKFNRQQQNASRPNPGPSSSSIPAPTRNPYTQPPSQSRDATVPSRFFPATPSTQGKILVPSSSPLTADGYQRPYQPYGQQHNYDVAHAPGLSHGNSWTHPRRTAGVDPLSAPSGFVSNGGGFHASLRRPWNGGERYGQGVQEDGPPRKRINTGPSQVAYELANSPASPEIQRPGQRRRIMNHSADNLSTSEEDSLPDVAQILAGPSKPRIMRGRAASPGDSPVNDPTADPKFIRFRLTMPMEDPGRVRAAWAHTKGDVKAATALLSDSQWVPPKPPSTVQANIEAMGRVKEIDEATKAQRIAAKEKGKKSMIYANRPVLEVKPNVSTPPPPPKPVIDLTAPSPISPLPVAMPRRKRVKKLVVDSDSEPEFEDSDQDERQNKRGRSDVTNDTRALDYFNTTAAEGLQELTGGLFNYSVPSARLSPLPIRMYT